MARRIDQDFQKVLSDSAFRDKVPSSGTEIVGLGMANCIAHLRQDLQKCKRAVEISGAKVGCDQGPTFLLAGRPRS